MIWLGIWCSRFKIDFKYAYMCIDIYTTSPITLTCETDQKIKIILKWFYYTKIKLADLFYISVEVTQKMSNKNLNKIWQFFNPSRNKIRCDQLMYFIDCASNDSHRFRIGKSASKNLKSTILLKNRSGIMAVFLFSFTKNIACYRKKFSILIAANPEFKIKSRRSR